MANIDCSKEKLEIYCDGVKLFELSNFTVEVSQRLEEIRCTERVDGKLVTKVSCDRDTYPRQAIITGDISGVALEIGDEL